MKCKKCLVGETKVLSSKKQVQVGVIRRRECRRCKTRFSTIEIDIELATDDLLLFVNDEAIKFLVDKIAEQFLRPSILEKIKTIVNKDVLPKERIKLSKLI